MTIDSTKIQKVKTAMDNRYENKQSNKKTSITGSFTGDTDSYPTAQAVKDYVEGQGYLTSHQSISGKITKGGFEVIWQPKRKQKLKLQTALQNQPRKISKSFLNQESPRNPWI